MPVLSRSQIRRRLAKPVHDPESLVITPLLDDAAIGDDAVDLRLGTHFILPSSESEPAILPDRRFGAESQKRVHVPLGHYMIVPAHQTVLGCTLEFIMMPYDLSAQILTKSSVARMFMVIETAPWVHPFYRGCLTLEIANVSNTPLLLYPGRAIGQLVLLEVSDPPKPGKLSGTYLGPIFPETPRFKDPEDDLRSIGIDTKRVRRPDFRRLSE